MSDDSYETIKAARQNWKEWHTSTYINSGGAEGHIVPLEDIGGHAFTTTLLLRVKGRKSGKTIVTPLIYGDIGGEVVIVASLGGADHHPAWYLNIREMEELEFQIATQAFRATWREPEGEERERVWAFMESVFPAYTNYQASTDRVIPLVMMKPVEAIAPITDDAS